MNLVPVVVENDMSVERSYDIFSRLLKDRIIFWSGEINDTVANSICDELDRLLPDEFVSFLATQLEEYGKNFLKVKNKD